jgi:hypothetical protein
MWFSTVVADAARRNARDGQRFEIVRVASHLTGAAGSPTLVGPGGESGFMKVRVMWLLLWLVAFPASADPFVAPDTKGTLEVEYTYDSSGKTKDLYDAHDWQVNRVLKMNVQLAADATSPMPSLHQLSAKEQADLKANQARAMASGAQAQQKMAPMMGDIQAIMAKCGEDEACIEKAVTSYGMSMQMTPELESAQKDIKDVAEAAKPGAPRYQMWHPTSQSGTYSMDEKVHLIDSDPICMEVPGAGGRCTIDIVSRGAGDIPPPPTRDGAAGISAVEFDSVGKTVMIRLPVPIGLLNYSETMTSNHPEKKSGTITKSMRFPPEAKPITASLKGSSQDQSGEQTIKLAGKAEEGGTLTVRWRFKAQ